TDNLGNTWHARYDAQGNVTSVTDPLANSYSFTYNLANQTLTQVLPATGQTGIANSYTQNTYLYSGGPLTQTALYDESGTQIRTVTHTYGVEQEHLSTSGSTEPVANTYDALYRIKTLTDGNGHTTTYSYSPAGYLYQVSLPGGDILQFPNYDTDG